jgi:lipid-binding SYLF domain-containing protein
MKRFLLFVVAAVATLVCSATFADDDKKEAKASEKREEINTMAKETIERLVSESVAAKTLFERAYGYAVFDNFKLSLLLASERGKGVAVAKASGDRTYMKMGSVGVNVGLGGQKMQVVFLFEDEATFNEFVNEGWSADASADAAAGKKGVNTEAEFVDGMATYQFTEKGLMLQANISGTRYSKDDKLNDMSE